MPIDRFRAMEVFTHVVQLGSFTRAAEALHLPKARVSTLVKELEAHLGVKLLNRTTRRLHLTDDGTVYQQRAVALLQEMNELEGEVTRAARSPAGRLRVDVPAAAGRHLIGPALPSFFRQHPHMVLELGSSDRPVDLIAEGVDCVIRGGLVHDEALVARKLGSLPVLTCAAPAYLASMGTPRTLQDLDRHMFVNFFSAKTGRIFPFEFDDGSGVKQISRPHWVSANDADTYIAAGVAGMGLMQSPQNRVVREHLKAGRLVPVLPGWDAGSLALTILYPPAQSPPLGTRARVRRVGERALCARVRRDRRMKSIGRTKCGRLANHGPATHHRPHGPGHGTAR
jgi:LysR family transcriptional regulator for bpeEF and oprC